MAKRRHSAQRVKRRRIYNVREAAKATGATPATVRQWMKEGLEPIEGAYPTIFRGADIIDFFVKRMSARGQPCGPGRIYCLRCQAPKEPAFGEVEFWPDGPKLGALRGLCPDCSGILNRRVSRATLDVAAGNLTVTIRHADPRLSETTEPRSNQHFERG